jgi:DNA polymerase-3 subunit gamma/tau
LRMLAFRPGASAAGGSRAEPEPRATKTPAARAASAASPKKKPTGAQSATPVASWKEPNWGALVTELRLDGAVRLLASNCVYLGRSDNVISLGLDPRSESMLTKKRAESLAQKLSRHFGEPLKVDIKLGAGRGETPVQEESRLADERMEAARQSLEADPNVQAMKNMFGAELKTDTIELIQTPQADQRNS